MEVVYAMIKMTEEVIMNSTRLPTLSTTKPRIGVKNADTKYGMIISLDPSTYEKPYFNYINLDDT
jgi:hypothetical protein